MKSSANIQPIHYQKFATPLGDMVAASYNNRLCLLGFLDRKKPETILKPLGKKLKTDLKEANTNTLKLTRKQLRLYFDSKISRFELPLKAMGTDFQKSVWKQLGRIPHGKTVNYGKIAERVGKPNGARAAGMAIGSNPISIIVPCHRVIGKSGALTGFAGGIWRKKWLLEHEGAI
ncbi:MAG: methylated-DNA--[protein]-cysteine S-methyltransferase [candidate division Zixibacteria bacterium]